MTPETGAEAVLSSAEPYSGATNPHSDDSKRHAARLAAVKPKPRSIPLDDFFLLPSELQQRIISLTCRCPDYSYDESQLASHDYTVFNLLCASRRLHDLVLPIMYAHIRLHHSTTLFALYTNLLLHPERGSLIKSLHLGPYDEMSPKYDWSLQYFEEDEQHGPADRAVLWLSTSLHCCSDCQWLEFSYHDREVAPKWYEPNFLICLDNPRRTCQGNALHRAVVAAMSVLDVDPYRREHGQHGQRIGLVRASVDYHYLVSGHIANLDSITQAAWCARVIELRAIMDLYLIQMRREEDEHGYTAEFWGQDWDHPSSYQVTTSQPVPSRCKSGVCGHYPALVVEPLSSAPLPPHEAPERVFWLTRKQIARHLRRPHDNAKTDRFDHPLIFAREGYPLQDADMGKAGQRKIRDRLAGPRSDLDEDPFFAVQEDESDEEEVQEDTAEVAKPSVSAKYGAGNASDYLRYTARSLTTSESSPGVETLSGLLALGRAVLALAPQLTNLSVGGIFHRLLVNSTPLPNKLLRCLCVGPVLPYWRTTFTSEGLKRLANIEKLRICVDKLSSREVDVICGQQDALPQLRVVQWEMVPLDEPATL